MKILIMGLNWMLGILLVKLLAKGSNIKSPQIGSKTDLLADCQCLSFITILDFELSAF